MNGYSMAIQSEIKDSVFHLAKQTRVNINIHD